MPKTPSQDSPPEHVLACSQAINKRENLFITGSAGTGKSHLCRMLVSDAEKNGFRVTKAAPTGIAAEAIGGCTLHRLLGLTGPLTTTNGNGDHTLASGSAKALLNTDILFIDEISMVSRPLFDILANTVLTARKEGGSPQLVISGDFYQLPPVIPPEEKDALRSLYPGSGRLYAFESEYWDDF